MCSISKNINFGNNFEQRYDSVTNNPNNFSPETSNFHENFCFYLKH